MKYACLEQVIRYSLLAHHKIYFIVSWISFQKMVNRLKRLHWLMQRIIIIDLTLLASRRATTMFSIRWSQKRWTIMVVKKSKEGLEKLIEIKKEILNHLVGSNWTVSPFGWRDDQELLLVPSYYTSIRLDLIDLNQWWSFHIIRFPNFEK